MKHRLVIILVLIVVVPLAAMSWLGARLARGEQALVRERFDDLLLARLGDVDRTVRGVTAARQQAILRAAGSARLPLRDRRNNLVDTGLVREFFVFAPNGSLTFPMASEAADSLEGDFYKRIYLRWQAQDNPLAVQTATTTKKGAPAPAKGAVPPDVAQAYQGWDTWYWRDGLNFVFWWRDGAGNVCGANVGRPRLLADIIAALPDTQEPDPQLPGGRIILRDAKGDVLYQWGRLEPGEDDVPRVTLALSPPFQAWRLDYHVTPGGLAPSGGGAYLAIVAGVAALAIALVGLALYFYRESARDMQEAAQRVTFVNQVSHELKTPLTNIRMYAELLDEDLGDDAPAQGKLGVIVSESQRLSRLIGNILSFSRRQRRRLKLHPQPGIVEDTVKAVLESVRPMLEASGIVTELTGQAPAAVSFDSDALEQILANLISNVEKYAASGEYLGVELLQSGSQSVITVRDRGPGIPADEAAQIFESFYRISNRLSDGVAGAGIGLAIARDLARLHGGDLCVLPKQEGAAFQLTLRTPPVTGVSS